MSDQRDRSGDPEPTFYNVPIPEATDARVADNSAQAKECSVCGKPSYPYYELSNLDDPLAKQYFCVRCGDRQQRKDARAVARAKRKLSRSEGGREWLRKRYGH